LGIYLYLRYAESSPTLSPLASVALVLPALALCLFGYVLYRAVITLRLVALGIAIGAVIALWVRSSPSGMDYFVASSAGAIVAGMVGLHSPRVSLLIWLGLDAMAIALALLGGSAWWAWTAAAVTGLATIILAGSKPALVALSATALYGGVLAVLLATATVWGGLGGAWSLVRAGGLAAWLLALVAAGLSIAGYRFQRRTHHMIHTPLGIRFGRDSGFAPPRRRRRPPIEGL
jgi:hypothetical protein